MPWVGHSCALTSRRCEDARSTDVDCAAALGSSRGASPLLPRAHISTPAALPALPRRAATPATPSGLRACSCRAAMSSDTGAFSAAHLGAGDGSDLRGVDPGAVTAVHPLPS